MFELTERNAGKDIARKAHSQELPDFPTNQFLFSLSKAGGTTVDQKEEMLKFAQYLVKQFEQGKEENYFDAHVIVMSVFSTGTDRIVEALQDIQAEFNLHNFINEEKVTEFFNKKGGPREFIKRKIDELFQIDEVLVEFLGGELSEAEMSKVEQAKKRALQWEEDVFERRMQQIISHTALISMIDGEVDCTDLENLAIGYGEDAVVGIYRELFALQPNVHARAIPYYTDPYNNHIQRQEVHDLIDSSPATDQELYNGIIDHDKKRLR